MKIAQKIIAYMQQPVFNVKGKGDAVVVTHEPTLAPSQPRLMRQSNADSSQKNAQRNSKSGSKDSAGSGVSKIKGEDKTLIDRLYRAILNRNADEPGLNSWAKTFTSSRRDDAIVDLVSIALASDEFRVKIARQPEVLRQGAMAYFGDRKIGGKSVRNVVAIGTSGMTSSLLNNYGVKNIQFLNEFDFLFDFFDESLVHDDDVMSGFKSQFEGATLFVAIFGKKQSVGESFEKIAEFLKKLSNDCELICIQLVAPSARVGCHSMSLIKNNGPASLYMFKPSSRELGVGFEEVMDDVGVMRLIWQYSFDF